MGLFPHGDAEKVGDPRHILEKRLGEHHTLEGVQSCDAGFRGNASEVPHSIEIVLRMILNASEFACGDWRIFRTLVETSSSATRIGLLRWLLGDALGAR